MIFLMLAVFIYFGVQGYRYLVNPTTTTLTYRYRTEDSISLSGYVVRSETVIEGDEALLELTHAEGERVVVDQVRFAGTVKDDNKIVIAGGDRAHLKAVDQKHGQRDARTARVEEKQVLQVGDFFHDVSVLSFYPE